MRAFSSIRGRLAKLTAAMPVAPSERNGKTSEEMIREVAALQAMMADLDAAGLRWPRETPLDHDEQATYERVLTAHGIPIRTEPLTAEKLAFIERIERLASETLAAEATGKEVQP